MRTMLVAALAAASMAAADTVHLDNGDRLSGTVESVKDGVVSLVTEYAGTVVVDQSRVTAIETEMPRAVKLEDATVLEGRLLRRDDAQSIEADAGTQAALATGIETLASDRAALDKLGKAKRWAGQVGAGLSMRTGNTDTTDFSLTSKITRKGERNTLTLTFEAAYGEADEILNTRRYFAETRWQYYLRPRLYTYLVGSLERDDGRKLELRALAGTGLGYEFIQKESRKLSAEAGLNLVRERWRPFTPWERDAERALRRGQAYSGLTQWLADMGTGVLPMTIASFDPVPGFFGGFFQPFRKDKTTTEEYLSAQLAVHFEQRLFKSSLISEDLALYPNLNELGEFRLTNRLAFSTPISDRLSLQCSLDSEYDSLASEKEVEEWDHYLVTSLQYSF